MICNNCGMNVTDPTSQFCPNCGAVLTEKSAVQITVEDEAITKGTKARTLGIVAMVFAFFSPLVSWICGGIGLSRAKKAFEATGDTQFKSTKTLCTVAIVVSVVLWALGFAMTFSNVVDLL